MLSLGLLKSARVLTYKIFEEEHESPSDQTMAWFEVFLKVMNLKNCWFSVGIYELLMPIFFAYAFDILNAESCNPGETRWQMSDAYDRYLWNLKSLVGHENVIESIDLPMNILIQFALCGLLYFVQKGKKTTQTIAHNEHYYFRKYHQLFKIVTVVMVVYATKNALYSFWKLPIWHLSDKDWQSDRPQVILARYYFNQIFHKSLLIITLFWKPRRTFMVLFIHDVMLMTIKTCQMTYDEINQDINSLVPLFFEGSDYLLLNFHILFEDFYKPLNKILAYSCTFVFWYLLYVFSASQNVEEKQEQSHSRASSRTSSPAPKAKAKKHDKMKKVKKNEDCKVAVNEANMLDFDDIQYFLWQSCLYGHKENLRKIIKSNKIEINKQDPLYGFTALHLAVWSENLSVLHILTSNCEKNLNFSIRNADGLNPLDLAIQKKNKAIIKHLLGLKKVKPELSSLIQAVQTYQHEFVAQIKTSFDKLFKNQKLLLCSIERFVDLGSELEKIKDSNSARRIKVEKDLQAYHGSIIKELLKISKQHDKNTQQENPQVLEANDNDEEQTLTIKVSDLKTVFQHFECCFCMELIQRPERIYACSNDHYFCSICLKKSMKRQAECPQCKENFVRKAPQLRFAAERILADLASMAGKDFIQNI